MSFIDPEFSRIPTLPWLCELHVHVYMFRAIWKFMQLQNWAARIRNCEIANQSEMEIQFGDCVEILCILEIASFLKQILPIDAIVAR